METWLWWTNARASIYFASPSGIKVLLCLDDFAPSCPAFLRPSLGLYGLERVAGGRCWQLFWALNRIGGKVLANVVGLVLPCICGEAARRRSYESRTCVNTVVGCHPGRGRGVYPSSQLERCGKNRETTLAGDNTCPIRERRCGAIFHSQTQEQRLQASLRTRVLRWPGSVSRKAKFR